MTRTRTAVITLAALIVVAGVVIGLLIATRPSDQLGPGKFLDTHATTTAPADPKLSAFQNALNGEGINVNDQVARQWAMTACTATTPNMAAAALDEALLANKLTFPSGQQENIADAALGFYCPN